MSDVSFELLVVDTRECSVINTEINLIHTLMGNGQLWKLPTCNNNNELVDGNVKVCAKSIVNDSDIKAVVSKGFIVTMKAPYSEVEHRRKPLVEFLTKQHFDSLYILTDQVSEKIALDLYPLLNRVENLMRRYLIKFMVTRLGPNWWDVTTTSDLSQKVRSRKNNETVFGDHIDSKAYLIDFGDLGKMIYSHSSGFMTKEDILKRIVELEESPQAIKSLKEQLQSNYQKFFKESFKDKGFQEKWENLEKLRHKTAHNSLFSQQDLEDGKALATSLMELIREADANVESIPLDTNEKEAIIESFVSKGLTWNLIGEDEFTNILAEIEESYTSQRDNGFVGLAHFVKDILGKKGYSYSNSFDIANKLEVLGKVEIYKVPSLEDDHTVTAIRLIK